MLLLPAQSWIQPEPYGSLLVIAPWNYPFQLAIGPLVAALAAVNCAVAKPSEASPHTSRHVAQLTGEAFEPAHHGFDTFSHAKSVVRRGTGAAPAIRYPPYRTPLGILRWILPFLFWHSGTAARQAVKMGAPCACGRSPRSPLPRPCRRRRSRRRASPARSSS
jgi:hypothetical protein